MNMTRVERKIARMRQEGPYRVVNYVAGLPREWHARVLSLLTPAEAEALTTVVRGREWRRANGRSSRTRKEDARNEKAYKAARAAAKAAAQTAREKLIRDLAAARETAAGAARFAAASEYTQRELRPLLSREEQAQLAAFRAEEMTRGKVCEVLGCTTQEFARWCQTHRLPVFRTKKLQSQKAARTFLRSEIEPLRTYVDTWRKQDVIRKLSRRRGLRLV
jgi:hypothetical protein